MPMSAADRQDKLITVERENNALKEKENFLRQEIVTMQTKFRRIEQLCKKRARAAEQMGEGGYDITDMERDLKGEVDDLQNQNTTLGEKIRKLGVVHRGLTKQMKEGPLQRAGLQKNEKYAHVQGKLDNTHSKVVTRYREEQKEVEG